MCTPNVSANQFFILVRQRQRVVVPIQQTQNTLTVTTLLTAQHYPLGHWQQRRRRCRLPFCRPL